MAHTRPRSDTIRQALLTCVAELERENAHHERAYLKHLADLMGLSPKVFSYWIKKGRVPRTKAEWLQRRFPSIVTASTLIG